MRNASAASSGFISSRRPRMRAPPIGSSAASRFPKLDAALLPIGGARILGRRLDMNPEEAADAFRILRPGHVIPFHYGLTGPWLFLTTTPPAEAPQRFLAAVVAQD